MTRQKSDLKRIGRATETSAVRPTGTLGQLSEAREEFPKKNVERPLSRLREGGRSVQLVGREGIDRLRGFSSGHRGGGARGDDARGDDARGDDARGDDPAALDPRQFGHSTRRDPLRHVEIAFQVETSVMRMHEFALLPLGLVGSNRIAAGVLLVLRDAVTIVAKGRDSVVVAIKNGDPCHQFGNQHEILSRVDVGG